MSSSLRPKFQPKGVWSVQDAWHADPYLAYNMPRLAHNAQLSVALKSLMPDTLKTGWSAHTSERMLIIKVPHNALAVKIKQIAPILLDGLKMIGWNLDQMEVKVGYFNHPVWLSSQKKTTPHFTARILSPASQASINKSISLLPSQSTLRHALMRILHEHQEK